MCKIYQNAIYWSSSHKEQGVSYCLQQKPFAFSSHEKAECLPRF